MTALVLTGASGFVGRRTLERLLQLGMAPICISRQPAVALPHGPARAAEGVSGSDGPHTWLTRQPDFDDIEQAWRVDLPGCTVIHLAGRAHVFGERRDAALQAFRRTNLDGTMRLAETAYRRGARRFVFVSSIKALGDTNPGQPPRAWREYDPSAFSDSAADPAADLTGDPYGRSKHEAEQSLLAYGRQVGLEVVIVRPPLVYGPGVTANFLTMMKLVASGLPIPLGAASARRSMVYLDNLVDVLIRCVEHPFAEPSSIVHVSDGADATVSEIVQLLAEGLQRRARLWPIPVPMLRLAAGVTGRGEQLRRLIDPLTLDIEATRRLLGWSPETTLAQGIALTAAWYRTRSSSQRAGR